MLLQLHRENCAKWQSSLSLHSAVEKAVLFFDRIKHLLYSRWAHETTLEPLASEQLLCSLQ